MAKTADHPQAYVSRVSLVGRGCGALKHLPGFKKQRHTVPDAVNAATTAFLGKICAPELTAEGERYFQAAKSALGYKRTDLTLEVSSPTAVLTTKDFTFELAYALEAGDPASYGITRTLSHLRGGALVELAEFNELFAALFTGVVFTLTKNVRVEAVVDVIEARGKEDKISVHYPSDCRHCVLSVEGVAAQVVCDGATLEMQFPRAGSPLELITTFGQVRSAFALTKNRVLAGLL